MTHSEARQRLIVALDVDTADEALRLADELQGHVGLLKVGLELFSACGPSVVEALVGRGHRIFLDLKLHDIPNTVAGACRAVSRLGVDLLTVHTSGGTAMLEAAREAAPAGGVRLLGVTVLTSLDAGGLAEIGVERPLVDQVEAMVRLSERCGLDGVVCSGQDLERFGRQPTPLFFVTPGIRAAGAAAQDQRRVLTPEAAIALGARYLVVGRPITRAADPAAAAEELVAGIERAMGG